MYTPTTLSANTLFHFTKSPDNLIGILRNGFEPRYCIDNLGFQSEDCPKLAIPMVCFCDPPLSQIKAHILRYGGHGIGVSKAWGYRHGINPVLYSYPLSLTSVAIDIIGRLLATQLGDRGDLKQEHEDGTETNSKLQEILATLVYTAMFNKPCSGHRIVDGEYTKEWITFYDEREWRYIPMLPKLSLLDLRPFLSENEYRNPDLVEANEQKIAEYCRLSFSPSDVKYLIVEKESEVVNMVDKIHDIKRLCTRIVSGEHIFDDF